MSIWRELQKVGFTKLETFDPDYFQHRNRTGFIILINERKKLSYSLYTVNTHLLLSRSYKICTGGYGSEGTEFHKALYNSEVSEWDIYFRPHGLYPGLRQLVRNYLSDYKSLNVIVERLDQTEATWAYHVRYEPTGRIFVIVKNKQLTDEEAIEIFLRKWRTSLEHSINTRGIDLTSYYKGCNHLAVAIKTWLKGEVENFQILEIASLAGKERKELVAHAQFENNKQTIAYRQEKLT